MTGSEGALLAALLDEHEPLTQYFVGLKVDRLVTDEEMLTLADKGLVSVWARWWVGRDPVGCPSYSLTRVGRQALGDSILGR